MVSHGTIFPGYVLWGEGVRHKSLGKESVWGNEIKVESSGSLLVDERDRNYDRTVESPESPEIPAKIESSPVLGWS